MMHIAFSVSISRIALKTDVGYVGREIRRCSRPATWICWLLSKRPDRWS